MAEGEVREVNFEEAVAEEQDASPIVGLDEPRPRPPASTSHAENGEAPEPQPIPIPEKEIQSEADAQVVQAVEDELEILAPPVEAREWTFGKDDHARSYIQSQLSVVGSAQWFKLLGEFLEEAMSGDNALSLSSLMQPPKPRDGKFDLTDFQDADMFVHALGKLLTHMPEFLEKSVCIWLAVPDYEWELVRELMRLSPTRGGMSHDQFEGIVETFIDQNYSEVDRFFRERFPRLRARYQARAKEASQSRSQRR